jgi:hypothetical protein
MAIDITCPDCEESENLVGSRSAESIRMRCENCGAEWNRTLAKKCATCGGDDLQTVPLAIVEKSRGTQLSVVGTRPVHLCSVCDADVLRHYHDHRPNPLMPTDLPTVGEEHLNG